MLTSFMGNVLCCLTGKPANVVVPAETSCSEPADGYEFVEVKPGRVLRVRHIARQRPGGTSGVAEGPAGTAVGCRRKIMVYRNGQLLIENLGESAMAEMKSCQANGKAPSAALEVDDPGNPSRHPEVKPQGRTADATSPPCSQGTEQQQPTRVHRRKPKRTVVIDCERRISSCKGSHTDLALFFVHGVGGSLDIWGRQLDFFSRQGYEVIAPDLVGHGASLAPRIAAAYTFYALAEDMRVIFRRYARKRNILIGHSYGVSFCTFLAHEYPDQVHKMVMINGGGPTALEPSLCSIFNLPTCVLHCLAPLLTWSFLKAGFARQGPTERQLLREHGAFSAPSFVLRATMGGQYWPEGDEAYHAEITVPTLLVHGMCDKFVPVEEDQRMAEILLLAFLKVLDDGSHMVMMECPEAVNTLLHEFFLWEPEPPPSKDPKVPPDAVAMVAPDDAQPSSAQPSSAQPAACEAGSTRGNA